ncbi:MAG TPA: hypothetical protein VF765_21970 [Polyangiaceae bacterium]
MNRAGTFLFLLAVGCSSSTSPAVLATTDGGTDSASDAPVADVDQVDAYAPSQPYASDEALVTIPSARTSDGGPPVELSFDLVSPMAAATPTRIVVLMAGGNGLLDLTAAGIEQGANNFVVRTRQMYAQAGFAAAVVDTPSDHPQGLDDFRATADHATDLGTIVQWLRAKWKGVPVWMIGTSRGTISVADAAARLAGSAAPDGIVLTSSITVIPASATDQESIYSVDFQKIGMPTQIVHNKLDECGASPFSGAQTLATMFAHTTFFPVDGGAQVSTDKCGALTYHGYYMLDSQVVPMIVKFVSSN